MSEMVEKVARAICKSVGLHEDAPARNYGALNDFPMWKTYERDAIAAIKAMAEPTETMIKSTEVDVDIQGPVYLRGKAAYQAMIKAAL